MDNDGVYTGNVFSLDKEGNPVIWIHRTFLDALAVFDSEKI